MTAGELATAGAVLLESAWVAVLIAAWTWAALRVTPLLAARLRYRIALVSLVAMALTPVMVAASSGLVASSWMAWLAAAWLAGLGVSGIRIANSLRSVRRLRMAARPASAAVQETFRARAAAMGLDGQVELAESDEIEVPCSLGLRSHLVLVPRGLSTRLNTVELDAIFAHELAHVARRDYAWHLLQLAATALLFHHPAAWWLTGIVDREREAACDARAATTVDPLAMAEALAALERGRPGVRLGRAARAPLLDRVTLLVRDADESADLVRTIGPVAAAVYLTLVGVVCIGLARAVPASLPVAMTMPAMMAVGLGLLVGVRHAFEPDHLVAVATLVAAERGAGEAMRLGASWGLGHTAALFALAAGLSVVRRGMPDTLGLMLELSVAAMIVGIGARALGDAWRMGGNGPVQEHAHGRWRHAHPTAAAHVHMGRWAIARGPLAVGLVHGLAGSGALTALAAATLSTLPEQLAFILCFGLGSTVGMAGVAGLAGWPLARLARRPAAMAALSATTGLVAVVFGAVWAYPLVQTLF